MFFPFKLSHASCDGMALHGMHFSVIHAICYLTMQIVNALIFSVGPFRMSNSIKMNENKTKVPSILSERLNVRIAMTGLQWRSSWFRSYAHGCSTLNMRHTWLTMGCLRELCRISHFGYFFYELICNGWERLKIRLTNSFICMEIAKIHKHYLSSSANSFMWMSRLMQNYFHLMAFCCLVADAIYNLHAPKR